MSSSLFHGVSLVFDLDGTVVDTAPDLVGAANHAFAGIGLPPISEAQLRPWVSFGAKRMITEGLTMLNASRGDKEVVALLNQFLAYYAANIARDSRPFPGALAALEQLELVGARLAICTNKREILAKALLETLGLASRFAVIAGRDTFPVHKPDPGHLLGVLERMGGDPARAIMIGDSEVDIMTAKRAGIPVLAVSFGYTDVPVRALSPTLVIDHWDELVSGLRAVLERPQSPLS